MTETPWHSAAEIQTIFNNLAPVYDELNQSLSLGLHRVWKLMAVKWCEPQTGDRALDLCCGSGDMTLMLAKMVGKTGKTIGLDFAANLLAIARTRPTLHPVEWLEGDALSLPFSESSFDCATMGYGLRNVVDIPLCLRELYRVLKPQARAAILDFHRPSQPWLEALQKWYLDKVVVPQAAQSGLVEEYAYLSPSLERFPLGREQVKLARLAGFTGAVHYPIAGGLMGILVIKK
jgi:demethylmenaquinone methyltransferase/2-methoxy-6-polyprenyl-1,4-benzoquinol methylase